MNLNYLSLLVIGIGIVLSFVVSTWVGLAVVAVGILMRLPQILGRT
jgi:hypothetical protein